MRSTPLRVERVPLIAAGARPAVFFAGRPTTKRASDARIRRNLALLFIDVAIQDHGRFGRIREGTHAPFWPSSVRKFHRKGAANGGLRMLKSHQTGQILVDTPTRPFRAC